MSTTTTAGTGATVSAQFSLDAEHHRSRPTAPVPENAKGPDVPEEGYVLDEIADGIFWIGDGSYQTMFVVTDEGVIAVDAPPTLGHNILRAIDRVTTQADHPGGLQPPPLRPLRRDVDLPRGRTALRPPRHRATA